MAEVILTDASGNSIGSADILAAHKGRGMLHKAFSIYVFDESQEQLLIQRRSTEKLLWAGIWANSCCSHPRKEESPVEAGERRLKEELGFTCALREAGSFVYQAEDPAGKGSEHEHVTLLIGMIPRTITITADPREVMEWKWVDIQELRKHMHDHPAKYAPWFHEGLPKVLAALP